MKSKLQNTKLLVIIIIATLAAMIIWPRVFSALCLRAYPVTMVGKDGLLQTKAYLLRFLLCTFISIVLFVVYAVACLCITIRVMRMDRLSVRYKICEGIICLLMIFGGLVLIYPNSSGMDVQGERFSRIPIVHTVCLLQAIEEDLKLSISDSRTPFQEIKVDMRESKYGIYSGIRNVGATEITEYELQEQGDGKRICQLSENDYRVKLRVVVRGKVQGYCYPNSGMLEYIEDTIPDVWPDDL